MVRSMENDFNEFYERLNEPGRLEWNSSWSNSLGREIFCNYPKRLTEEKGVSLFELNHLKESFSGFVNVKDSLIKNTLKKQWDIIYLEKGDIKYTQKTNENCIETSFVNKENDAIVNRSYDNRSNEKNLAYLLNFIRFVTSDDKCISFAQSYEDIFSLSLSNLGSPFPRIMFDIKSNSKLARSIVNDSSILKDTNSLIKFVGDKDCSIYLRDVQETPKQNTLFQAVEVLGISFFRV